MGKIVKFRPGTTGKHGTGEEPGFHRKTLLSTSHPEHEEGPQQPAGRRHPRPRIETLADLIFGLSLSIGSIALLANAPTSSAEINSHILAFAFTFLILITAWLIYTTYMSVLPVETRAVTFLNVALLLLVALVPYLLNTVEIANASLTTEEASKIRDYSSTSTCQESWLYWLPSPMFSAWKKTSW